MNGGQLDLDEFLQEHQLPPAFARTASAFYLPLARWVNERITESAGYAFVLGINGAQGTGKSTLSRFLARNLQDDHGRSVAELSIDDIYLTRAERERLAGEVHPLLLTRGVPGTHDVDLGMSVLERLGRLKSGDSVALPRFDKSTDDRQDADTWPEVEGPIDLVIFEGWCVGSRAAAPETLDEPLNALEAEEDRDGSWRRYANDQLRLQYPPLFEKLNALVYLQAPGFHAVRRWRLEQEEKLARRSGSRGTRLLDDSRVARFVQHFERITRDSLVRLPLLADVVLTLDEEHAVTAAAYP